MEKGRKNLPGLLTAVTTAVTREEIRRCAGPQRAPPRCHSTASHKALATRVRRQGVPRRRHLLRCARPGVVFCGGHGVQRGEEREVEERMSSRVLGSHAHALRAPSLDHSTAARSPYGGRAPARGPAAVPPSSTAMLLGEKGQIVSRRGTEERRRGRERIE